MELTSKSYLKAVLVTSKAAEASGSGAKPHHTELGSAKAAGISVMHFSDEGAKFSTAGKLYFIIKVHTNF